MPLLLPFLCGAIGGAVTTLFVFAFVFLKIEELLQSTVRRREEKALQYKETAAASDGALQSKVQAVCSMACFDNNIVGHTIPVRAVLYGRTIYVYRVDSDSTAGGEEHPDTAREYLIGKINTVTVASSSEKVSKYHRHTGMTRHAPVRGKCLVLRRKEGLPLFLQDPVAELARQHQRQYEQQRRLEEKEYQLKEERRFGTLRHHRHGHGNSRRNKHHDAIHRQGYAMGEGSTNVIDYSNSDGADVAIAGANHGEAEHSFSDERDHDDFGTWTAVLFKLPTRRELERWLNLLQTTPQSEEWRGFIKRLPQIDVFNLVMARLFFENTRTSGLQDLFVGKLRRKLRKVSSKLPKHMQGEILLDRLELGDEIPLIHDVSEPSVSPNGELEFDFDLLYRGGLQLSLRFSITYRGVRVPDIIFKVKMLELSNRMRLSVGPPPTGKIWVGSSRLPQLRLEFTQEVASHDGLLNAVLKLMPDMSVVMTNVVKVKLFEDMLLPSMEDFPLPCFSYSPNSSDRDSPVTDLNTAGSSSIDERCRLNSMPPFTVTDTRQIFSLAAVEATDVNGAGVRPLDIEMINDETASFVSSGASSTLVPGSSVSAPWRRVKSSKAKQSGAEAKDAAKKNV
ncbi:hypothetical protein DQ04_04271040 [Trypanosoma grayi]|uniref:hypothetical protein n=1 Tax=Trypanosoma grayi TaxID=71804 RepID=UPI0004F3FE4E|nr:hypothetical protein DQ04_04271040 [Trypanosoma grayi]KEG10036.1 hypothetical protein DQ04_04271040 [Trypanosoma grayi]